MKRKQLFYRDPKEGSEETAEVTEAAEQESGSEGGGGEE